MLADDQEDDFGVAYNHTVSRSAVQKQVTFVVVEDAQISKLVHTVLRKHGYAAVAVAPSEAVRMLRSGDAANEVLLTNSPSEFLEFASTTRLLYLTSSPDPSLQIAFRACRVVRKPFSPNQLLAAVADLAAS